MGEFLRAELSAGHRYLPAGPNVLRAFSALAMPLPEIWLREGLLARASQAGDKLLGLLKAGGNINVVASWGTTRMDLTANTDLTGQGRIDVYTNGDVSLTEVQGDLRAGSITSTQNDVTLVAQAGIVDAQGDGVDEVVGQAGGAHRGTCRPRRRPACTRTRRPLS